MRRIGIILGLALVLVSLATILRYVPALRAVNDQVSKITVPVSRALSGGIYGVQATARALFNSRGIGRELAILRARANQLSAQVADLQMLAAENASLKKQLNFLEETQLPFVTASVVGQINDNGRSVLLLDRGEQYGVGVGMPLIAEGGVLIGKIIKTEKQKSMALVTTANHSRIAATPAKSAGTKGVVAGSKNLSIAIEYVPADVPLAVGDIIVTSGLETLVPRGLVIGAVDEITASENALFQKAYLTVPYALSELRYINIILPNGR